MTLSYKRNLNFRLPNFFFWQWNEGGHAYRESREQRAEQSWAELSRAEQSWAEQSWAELSRAKQSRAGATRGKLDQSDNLEFFDSRSTAPESDFRAIEITRLWTTQVEENSIFFQNWFRLKFWCRFDEADLFVGLPGSIDWMVTEFRRSTQAGHSRGLLLAIFVKIVWWWHFGGVWTCSTSPRSSICALWSWRHHCSRLCACLLFIFSAKMTFALAQSFALDRDSVLRENSSLPSFSPLS